MIKHKFQSGIADGADNTLVQPSDWNDDHAVDGGLDLPAETVTAPAADNVRLFGRKVGGRMMPAFKGPSGLDTSLQPHIGRNKISLWSAPGNSTTVTQIATATATGGTATSAAVATTNLHTAMRRLDYLVTTPATTAVAYLASSGAIVNQFFRGSGALGGFHFIARFGGATGMATSTHRFFAGFTSESGNNPTDRNPSAQPDVLGIGYDAADSNWKLMHRTGTGTVNKVDLGASFPRQTADRSKMYEVAIFAPPGGSSVFYEFTDLETGAVASGEITTSLPASTTLLKWLVYASAGGTSSVIGVSVSTVYIETDY